MIGYKVGIIGAGGIVCGYDTPGSSEILTHCHALKNHPRFDIVGIYDVDAEALVAGTAKWNLPAVSTFAELLTLDPDVFLIAAPDDCHDQYLSALLGARPRLVFCEKPLTTSVESSIAFVAQYHEAGVPLTVGYQRRFDVDLNSVRDRFGSGELGAFLTGSVLYSKGLLHSGSHAIDLLRYLFGDVIDSEVFSAREDFTPEDLSISGRLVFPCGEVFLMVADERSFSLFEIDLVFERGRYRFTDSGMNLEIHSVREDPNFTEYTALVAGTPRPSSLSQALGCMWDETARALDHLLPMVNSGAEAVATQMVCHDLIAKFAARDFETQ